tara:strand:- start:276 stop:734 length:459 start_codon:yes stop_codon:yes gene_type:complete
MKKIADYVVRGQVTPADSGGNRIQLFDGKFTTGYRITRFELAIADRDNTSTVVCSGKLTTEPSADNTTWDWSDVRELAWATSAWDANGLGNAQPFPYVIDPDNMIVEDVFISAFSGAQEVVVNYLIVFEKYRFDAWDGAATMVRNLSQAGPQ